MENYKIPCSTRVIDFGGKDKFFKGGMAQLTQASKESDHKGLPSRFLFANA